MLVICVTETYQTGKGHFLPGDTFDWPEGEPLSPHFEVTVAPEQQLTAAELAQLREALALNPTIAPDPDAEAAGVDLAELRKRPGFASLDRKNKFDLVTELAGLGIDAQAAQPKRLLIKLILDARESLED